MTISSPTHMPAADPRMPFHASQNSIRLILILDALADLESCVLVLNREGMGGLSNTTLSLFPPLAFEAYNVVLRRAFCSAVFSSTRRWPRKLRCFGGFLTDFADGSGFFGCPCISDAGGSRVFPGSCTLRILIVVASFLARAFRSFNSSMVLAYATRSMSVLGWSLDSHGVGGRTEEVSLMFKGEFSPIVRWKSVDRFIGPLFRSVSPRALTGP